MDRRKFFQQSKTELGSQLSEWLGASRFDVGGIGKLLGQFLGKDESAARSGRLASAQDARPGAAYRYRRLVREAEPMNQEGHPFGGHIEVLTGILAPDALPGRRVLAVVGHRFPRPGISVLDLERIEAGWRHNVASPLNKRWAPENPVPIEGAFFDVERPEVPAHWERGMTAGVEEISCLAALPWQTVLLGEGRENSDAASDSDFGSGWLVEVNAVSGTVVRRFAMGRLGPVAIEPVTCPGRPSVVYIFSREGYLFKFVSLQRFDSQRHDANLTALAVGALYAADCDSGTWLLLGKDASPAEWTKRMRDPIAYLRGLERHSEPFNRPQGLSWNRRTGELLIRHAGAVSVVKEHGAYADDGKTFEFRLEEPAAAATPAATASSEILFHLPRGEALFAEDPHGPSNGDGLASLCIKELA